jgi:hypothetical protein
MSPANVQRFWKWFADNAARLANYTPDHLNLTNEIRDALRRIHQPDSYSGGGPSLSFEIHPHAVGHEFIISASGIESAFHLARKLIAAAPPLEGWKFTALIQRSPTEQVLADFKFGADDVWFSFNRAGNKANIVVFINNLSASSEHDPTAIRPFLLYILGEETFGTKVDTFDCQRLPPDPQNWGLKPLKLLPETVDALS